MHLFVEIVTLLCFLITVAHAIYLRPGTGSWLMGSLLFLGYLRESFVIFMKYLYGFAPLTLMLGPAPVIVTVIWGYSIYAAVCWAEGMRGDQRLEQSWRSPHFLALVGIFMMALACFYEPFLALIAMARWEEGTRFVGGVPLIALIGYPTLAVPAVAAWGWIMERFAPGRSRLAALFATMLALGLIHAAGLQGLKNVLGL